MRVLIYCLVVLLAGCQYLMRTDMPKDLEYKTSAFEDTVRWGTLENMYAFLRPDPDNPIEIPQGLDNVRVTSYESASPLTKVDETRWVQTVVVDYVLTDRQVVRQLVDQQVWESDDEGKTWYRTNPVPEFR
jgi:hypothetical protein